MLFKGLSGLLLGTALTAVLFLGGCRSATKDRIRVLEAEKAEWGRQKAELGHQNAKLRGDLLRAESSAKAAKARAESAAKQAAIEAQNPSGRAEDAGASKVVFNSDAIRDGLAGMQGIKVTEKGGGATIVLASDVTFKSGRADLSPNAERALHKVAEVLKRTPGVARVRIVGHTDSDPIVSSGWESNEGLSLERARGVQKFLLHEGVAGDLTSIEGLGASEPVASNKTKAGKAANRRVEILVSGG